MLMELLSLGILGKTKKCKPLVKFYRNTFIYYTSPDLFPLSANCLQIDKTGNNLYVGYDKGKMTVIFPNKKDPKEGTKERDPRYSLGPEFKASDLSVNGIGINLSNTQIYTGASDGNVLIWS